ncbi:hypothetical protein D3C75_499340 [compost metagenome]
MKSSEIIASVREGVFTHSGPGAVVRRCLQNEGRFISGQLLPMRKRPNYTALQLKPKSV